MKKLGHSTVQRKAWTLAQFFDFLIVRYQGDVHALTGHVLVQPIDEFNRPAKSEYGTPRIPPAEAEVDQLFAGWRELSLAAACSAPLFTMSQKVSPSPAWVTIAT
ncbi:hypothetical protein AB0C60_14195, partial [Streptomyces sp. NPDC048845]